MREWKADRTNERMTMVLLRKARSADVAAINSIYNDAVLKTVATMDTVPRSLPEHRRWFKDHGTKYPVIVAELEGEVVGWASLSKWSEKVGYARTVEVSVYVDESHRGRGFGRTLLEAIVEEGRRAGFHVLVSRIVKGTDVSIRLHRKLGFRKAGVMREAGRKFGKWLDVLVYQKNF